MLFGQRRKGAAQNLFFGLGHGGRV
jgi:hypothetical protein